MATQNKKRSFKKVIFPSILALVLVGAIIFTIREYIYFQSHEVTDNAQIDADISPVIARVSGYVKEIRFNDNQFVHKGDTLLVLDDRDYQIKLEQALAALGSTRKNVQVSRSAVSESKAGQAAIDARVEAAKVRVWKANQDFNRYKNLYDEHAITLAQFETAKAEKEAAEASLAEAQSQRPVLNTKVTTSQEQVSATASTVEQRQADVDYARLQLSYTVITAPASGVVSKRTVQVGQLVQQGQPMFSVVDTRGLYVTANFKETQMESLRIGEPVDLLVDAYEDKLLGGTVESFSGATGARFSLLPPDNATGNFVKVVQRIPVRITLNAPDSMLARLRPGMSVKVVVHTK